MFYHSTHVHVRHPLLDLLQVRQFVAMWKQDVETVVTCESKPRYLWAKIKLCQVLSSIATAVNTSKKDTKNRRGGKAGGDHHHLTNTNDISMDLQFLLLRLNLKIRLG